MLRSVVKQIPMARWTYRKLRAVPGRVIDPLCEFTQWASRTWRSISLCRGRYPATAEALRERFEALERIVGPDRLPVRTRPALLAGWLEELHRTAGDAPPARPRRILFFTVMPHWVEFSLPIATVLAARNCVIDFVWLPYNDMSGPNPADILPAPGCEGGHFLPSVQLHDRLRSINLLHVAPSSVPPGMGGLAAEGADFDTRYFLRRESIDVRVPEVKRVVDFRLRRNLDCLARLQTLFCQRRYDLALIPNGVVYEFRMAYLLAQRKGLRCTTFDFSERKQMIMAAKNAVCVDFNTADLWRADEPHRLTPEREGRVMGRLVRRENPNWQEGDYNWQGQTVSPESANNLRRELGISPDKTTAMLCTNIAHDTAVLGQSRAFRSMAEWVLETVAWFARRPDLQLLVRCHPAEALYPSGEPVPELIASRFPCLPDNIRIIKPADRVNTYGLMRLVQLGLVYTTTVGLEMACRGMRPIVAGKVHYGGKDFTTEPANPAEYFAALERECAAAAPGQMTARQIELARCYADVYFEKLPRLFPWSYPGDVEKDMGCWPVERILREDCPPAFLETFDFLAGHETPAAA